MPARSTEKIDEFLQNTQLNDDLNKIMEWIPYNRLFVKDYLGEGGFGIINLASWIDGPILFWNDNYQH